MVGIVAAISLPNFVGAQAKAKEASVKANMRSLQIVAESYAIDHAGNYPTKIDTEVKSYYPNGSNDGKTRIEGSAPVNPFTSVREWPVLGKVTDLDAARADVNAKVPEGTVRYSAIYSGNHEPLSYAIMGGGKEGHVILNTKKDGALVLSNN